MPSRLPIPGPLALSLCLLALSGGCASGWRPLVRQDADDVAQAGSIVEVVPAGRRASPGSAPYAASPEGEPTAALVRPPAPPAARARTASSGSAEKGRVTPTRGRSDPSPAASSQTPGAVRYEPLSPARSAPRGTAPKRATGDPGTPVEPARTATALPDLPASPTGLTAPVLSAQTRSKAPATRTPPQPVAPSDREVHAGDDEEHGEGEPKGGAPDEDELGPDEVEEPLAPAHLPPPRGSGPGLADRRDPFYAPRINADGIAAPYPPDRMFRGFGRCLGGTRHHHEGIDLGGLGPHWGLGTPIRSMARAEVVFIGRGDQNPELFGTPDLRRGHVTRGRSTLPRRAFVEGYGEVAFFTRRKGRWRSGNIVVTRGVDGPLKGHLIRYMHMGAIHPDLRPGQIVEAGDELALMGGTGVQESAPHLHLDMEAPDGHRVDVAPLIGLPATASCEGLPTGLGDVSLASATLEKANKYRRVPTHGEGVARIVPAPVRRGGRGDTLTSAARRSDGPRRQTGRDEDGEGDEDEEGEHAEEARERVRVRRAELSCGQKTLEEDFARGRYDAHAFVVQLRKGDVLQGRLGSPRGGWSGRLTATGRGLSTKRARGVVTVRAMSDTEALLRVEDARGERPPRTAAYALTLKAKCRAGPREDGKAKGGRTRRTGASAREDGREGDAVGPAGSRSSSASKGRARNKRGRSRAR
jgi:murein DD-endopeptidase MepM/ murein hydrolase activator NlpD